MMFLASTSDFRTALRETCTVSAFSLAQVMELLYDVSFGLEFI